MALAHAGRLGALLAFPRRRVSAWRAARLRRAAGWRAAACRELTEALRELALREGVTNAERIESTRPLVENGRGFDVRSGRGAA